MPFVALGYLQAFCLLHGNGSAIFGWSATLPSAENRSKFTLSNNGKIKGQGWILPFPTSGNPSARFLTECVQNIATIKCKKRDGQGWIPTFPTSGSPSAENRSKFTAQILT